MDAKIKIIHTFVGKFLFYFGKTYLTLIIINAILWWKLEDREHRGFTFTDNQILTIRILYSILFVAH